MNLLVIIVNYKTPDLTLRAVAGALRETEAIPDARIVVVDNDSQDGSYEKMVEGAKQLDGCDRVEILDSGRNGGFAYGNNIAIRRAMKSTSPPEYFYLLNSDAFPDEGCIRELVDHMEENPDVGIAGSFTHGPDGTPHHTAFRFPSVASEFENSFRLGLVSKLLSNHVVAMPIPEENREVDWLAGASMMVRRRVFEDIGLFDEQFFLYFEETDLCRRARMHGWKVVYVRDSSVVHIGHASTNLQDPARRMPGYWFDSRRHYFAKNHGHGYLRMTDAARIVGLSLFRVRQRIQRKMDDDPPRFLRDFIEHSLGRQSPFESTEA